MKGACNSRLQVIPPGSRYAPGDAMWRSRNYPRHIPSDMVVPVGYKSMPIYHLELVKMLSPMPPKNENENEKEREREKEKEKENINRPVGKDPGRLRVYG
jgi:hypothetical protein